LAIDARNLPTFDPYDIKKSLVDLTDEYFQLKNIDLYESGFLGYFIQALTYLTSDMLFQNALAYNEAFLIRATLPSTVYNIAAQLDYKIQNVVPASGTLKVVIPLASGDMKIKIPAGSNVTSESAAYKVIHNYYVTKDSTTIEIIKEDIATGIVTPVTYNIEISSGQPSLVFDVEIQQLEIYTHSFTFENTQLYKFYDEPISGFKGYIYDVVVNVGGELYKPINSIYIASSSDKVYELMMNQSEGSLVVRFGNGIHGYLPHNGAQALITIYSTLGAEGNIAANTAQLADRVIDGISGDIVNVISYNPLPIMNGSNGETLEEVKKHIIENISAAKRLVTEKDYKGFQGVTGITDLIALPVLQRRDVYGNEITLYIVKYDSDKVPMPTASIPVQMDNINNVIEQGSVLTYDNISYVSPFKIEYDDNYDIPLARYFYNLNNLKVSPSLAFKSEHEDILMGARTISVYLYPNTHQMSITTEVYKLTDMTADKIHAEFQIGNNYRIPLTLTKVYDDNTTCIFSSNYIDYESYIINTGVQMWYLYLYFDDLKRNWNFKGIYNPTYVYSINDVVNYNNRTYISLADNNVNKSLADPNYWEDLYATSFYNTYRGSITLFKSGLPIDTDIVSNATSSNVPTPAMFNVYTLDFKYLAGLEDKCMFSVDILNLASNIDTTKLSVTLHINNRDYTMHLNTAQIDRFTFITDNIPLDDFVVGDLHWTIDITYELGNLHQFSGDIEILSNGKRIISNTISAAVEESDTPQIELVHIGLNSIQIKSTPDNKFYKFICNVSKLPENSSMNISLHLNIAEQTYSLHLIGDTPEGLAVFETDNINTNIIQPGLITFDINIYYKGEFFASYKQSVVLKQEVTNICHSNIAVASDGVQYVFGVPVIKQEYYDAKKDVIDELILNQLAKFSTALSEYKMLTDNINIKFVKTSGYSNNMQLNLYNSKAVITYPDTFAIEIPPKIKVRIYVKRKSGLSINSVISECKNVLYTFLTLKAGFHSNIYRSEMARYLHDVVDDVEFCEILEPTQDIVYDFDIENIPSTYRDIVYKYCPEFIWFSKDKIEIETNMID
jgi:hypothetical protein